MSTVLVPEFKISLRQAHPSPSPLPISRLTWPRTTIMCYISIICVLRGFNYPTFSTVPSSSFQHTLDPNFCIPWPILPSHFKWSPLCSPNPTSWTTLSLFLTASRPLLFLSTIYVCPPLLRQRHLVIASFPKYPEPKTVSHFPRGFVFWSTVSLPSSGTFHFLSNFNILFFPWCSFQHPLWLHLSWPQCQQALLPLCLSFSAGWPQLGPCLYPECICSGFYNLQLWNGLLWPQYPDL